jgi:UDP-N-acetylglucosamine 2-epimerase (non-hydrolysing)
MILICFGTRPEYLKVKPLFSVFEKEGIVFKKVFTGQHEDLLKEVNFDYRLKISETKNRLNSVFASTLIQAEDIFVKESPTYVMVQGDTTSACAFALSAYHHRIKIIHLEAGLRTYDRENPYP